MPEKPLTVATYAAGASLAAITLVYVFGPTFFLDDRSASSRKQGVIGLVNPANDCFINSILQALAGVGDLRVYLIQELHQRRQDGEQAYLAVPTKHDGTQYTPVQLRKAQGLLDAIATQALKDMLDKLNERPLYAKTISAGPFIHSLEQAFNTRLNRQQQDAQELLQLLLERLLEECQAGTKARAVAQKRIVVNPSQDVIPQDADMAAEPVDGQEALMKPAIRQAQTPGTEAESADGATSFPFEGKTETIIECQTCNFTPKPNVSTFVTLTLNVPQTSSTTLDACFDGLTKQEYIDDYRCDRCRLVHAVNVKTELLSHTSPSEARSTLEKDVAALRHALATDPEQPPEHVSLPDPQTVPRRRISKHTRLSLYPAALAVHLSRSIFDPGSYSQKNTSKVAFPEHLHLGSLGGARKRYRLLALVTHHGGHNSGHYETFRRQVMDTPGLRPKSLEPGRQRASQLLLSPTISPVASPVMPPADLPASPTAASENLSTANSQASTPIPAQDAPSRRTSLLSPPRSGVSLGKESDRAAQRETLRRRKKESEARDKWWRMSDDKVKECRTSAVLGMQRDAYLLFYELQD